MVANVAHSLPTGQVRTLADAVAPFDGPSTAARSKALGAVPVARFADKAGRLMAAWEADPEISGAGLAVALRAATNAVEAERRSETVQIVWTGPTTGEVPVRLTREVLIDVIRSAKRDLIVVSFAAYKVPAVVEQLGAAADREVNVRLILEQPAEAGGALHLAAAPAFQSILSKVSLFEWPAEKRPKLANSRASLHAKATVADDHTAFITSANFTGHAIKENIELGLLISGGAVPKRLSTHFRRLIDEAIFTPLPGP